MKPLHRNFFCFLLLFVFVSANTPVWGQDVDKEKAFRYIQEARKHYTDGRLEDCVAKYEKATNILEAAGDWEQFVVALNQMAKALLDFKKPDRALPVINRALEVSKARFGPRHKLTAETLEKRGQYYYEKRDFESARMTFEESLSIKIEVYGSGSPEEAGACNNLGVTYGFLGDTDKQLYFLQRALDIRLPLLEKNPGNTELEERVATSYNNLADVYKRNKDYDKQLQLLQKALDLWIKVKGTKHDNVAKAYSNISTYYAERKDYAKEEFFLLKAITMRLSLPGWEENTDIAKNYDKLAMCYENIGDTAKAKSYYTQSLSMRIDKYGRTHSDVGESYLYLARFYLKHKDYDQSMRCVQSALSGFVEGFDQTDFKQNPKPSATDVSFFLLDALELKNQNLSEQFSARGGNEKLDLALASIDLALDLVDSTRYSSSSRLGTKEQLINRCIGLYERSIATAYALYKATGKMEYLEKAFLAAERSKAFRLLSALRDIDAKNYAGVPDSLQTRENFLKSKIYELQKQLDDAKNKLRDPAKADELSRALSARKYELSQLISRLEKLYPKYYALKYKQYTATVADVRKKLLDDGRTVLLEFMTGRDAWWLFVVTQNDLKLYRLDRLEEIVGLVATARKQLSDPKAATEPTEEGYLAMVNALTGLYDRLLREALQPLAGKADRLVVVPDGVMSLLPFEVLLTKPVAPGTNYADLPYLLRDFMLSYTHSATLRIENRKRRFSAGGAKCLAYAPTYNRGPAQAGANRDMGNIADLLKETELPGALKEVKAISGFFRGSYRFAEEATKANFLREMQDYEILHLAMHGKANSSNPWSSTLSFSPDSVNGDVLYAWEILSAELRADLVVLSACETGFGRTETGEGVGSLARGFMSAGAPSVLLTLWKVNDQSSTQLMTYFYQGLSEGMDIDEALRFAKLEYLKTASRVNAHPFFWAGFVPYGNTASLPRGTNLWWWVMGGVVLAGGVALFWRWRKK